MEIHYPWHPRFRCKVVVHHVARRANGEFVQVQDPDGVFLFVANWMLDPITCAKMTIGAPRVDVATLIELTQVLIGASKNRNFRGKHRFAREKGNEVASLAGSDSTSANQHVVRRRSSGGLEALDRDKVVTALAHILMQAAGLRVEEADDDEF